MPITGAALVTAGIGAYHLIKGISDSKAAAARARLNIRPAYNIPDEYFNNQGIASNLAQEGLTDSAKNYYQTNAERGLGSSIGAELQTGGGLNGIQKLYDTYDRNNQAIAAQDSQQKIENIKNLMAVNNQLADQKTQQWVLNEYQPYLDNSKSIAAQKAQAGGEENSGLEGISGAVSAWAKGQKDPSDKNSYASYTAPPVTNNTLTPYVAPTNLFSSSVPVIPNSFAPATAMSIQPPSSFDDLAGYQGAAKQVAMSDVMSKYKNSPYAPGLYNYLQTA